MSNKQLIDQLTKIVLRKNVLLNEDETEYYRSGFRSGTGSAIAVVFPQTLTQQWQTLKACVEAGVIVIMQAANTGLTEGSTPNGDDYDRDIVIINTTRINGLFLLDEGKQIVALPGATLFKLEELLKPLKREPHSVIGSSCIGASIVGGVANNSGGSLVKRGPAYTELSVFARLDENGTLELVNHLGIDLGNSPEQILDNLQAGNFKPSDVEPCTNSKASSNDYESIVRQVNADSPARYNADPSRLYEASGCAGKLAIFAVRLDTYPEPKKKKIFYIGTSNTARLTQLRETILSQFDNLPESAEYIHRGTYDIAKKYGKDTLAMIYCLGTEPLPKLFAIKGAATGFLNKLPLLPKNLPDHVMQIISHLIPISLPKRMTVFREKYDHHLILEMSDEGIEEAEKALQHIASESDDIAFFECTDKEAKKAKLHRFAAAGAAVRYEVCHQDKVESILALDIALRRNDKDWFEQLPESISKHIEHSMYYGHFMCHVMHQDYIIKKGSDPVSVKKQMLEILQERGAKYPAEHNVGHLYEAEPQLKSFYSTLDPSNTFNPGIGKTSKMKCGCSAG